jgi:dTDP-glucose pyrophosphorylase
MLFDAESPMYEYAEYFQSLFLMTPIRNYKPILKLSLIERVPQLYLLADKREFMTIFNNIIDKKVEQDIRHIFYGFDSSIKKIKSESTFWETSNLKNEIISIGSDISEYKNICMNYDSVKDPYVLFQFDNNQLYCVGREQVSDIMNIRPKSLLIGAINTEKTKEYRDKNYKIIPIVNEVNEVVDILNFRLKKALLPLDVVIMAGGRGTRLLPITENIPKPLLKVGNKPIIEYIIDGLITYGITNIHISINHLGHLIQEALGDGSSKGITINYIEENQPLGTIGSVSLKKSISHPHTLVLNSDLLTALDYEDYFIDFLNKNADFSAVGIPYKVDVPYGIFEMEDDRIIQIREKPTYTYFSNGGIYLFKSELIEKIPKGQTYLATEFIDDLIAQDKKVISYSLYDYWLDIGSHSDFQKAQTDVKKYEN